MMDYIVKKDCVDIVNNGYKLLIISKKDESLLAESEGFKESNEEIRLIYDELEYVSTTNNEILITLESIINKFKKHE